MTSRTASPTPSKASRTRAAPSSSPRGRFGAATPKVSLSVGKFATHPQCFPFWFQGQNFVGDRLSVALRGVEVMLGLAAGPGWPVLLAPRCAGAVQTCDVGVLPMLVRGPPHHLSLASCKLRRLTSCVQLSFNACFQFSSEGVRRSRERNQAFATLKSETRHSQH
eukprot:610802-Rhodomonas_salina.1